MAQAARLNLRMQKEIKLLLNDPPHGVSLNLSEDQSALSSLSSIEARIKGPDGTVYSKGVFVLKIQIPERYPFQPPNVTFVTPIYHPNIDNGGRICLDILNLPPKGAWQPSLNIATILTSIGLLLSEPNPDDGLMAEISREYKYNRQVFDINARSWTEKYANPAAISASGWSSVDDSILAQNTQMEEIQNLESLPKASNKECEGSRKKMRLLGQKLSLKSEGSEENTTTGKQDLVANHVPSTARSTDPTACSSDVSSKQNATLENMSVSADSGAVLKKEYQGNGKNLKLLGQRLSATPEAPSKRSNGNVEDKLPNHLPTSTSNTKDPGMQSSDDVLENSMTKSIDRSSDSLYKVSEGNNTNVRSLGQKMSLKLVKPENESNDQKENMAPNHLPSLSGFNNLQKRSSDVSRKSYIGGTNLVQQNSNTKHLLPNTQSIPNKECDQGRKKLRLLSKRLSLKSELPEMDRTSDEGYKPPKFSQNDRNSNELPLSVPVPKSQTMGLGFADSQKDANQGNCSVKQNATPMENIVVSDSEDSADECERPSRSRLSLMRRRLAEKLKS